MLLVRNAIVYAPGPLGRKDILAAGGEIVAIADDIDPGRLPCEVDVLDAGGLVALPGLVDSHVHILGGGGEGGYSTRTPELRIVDCIRAGVSTVIGTLGTDGVARSMESLVAKAHSIREQGLSAWVYSGSYRVPPATITGDLMKDIMMIDPVIGAGEIAISDHRSSRPSLEELGRLASEARVGGLLSGKAGIVNLHVGDAPAGLGPLEALVAAGDLPHTQFLPTHCGRSGRLFAEARRWAAAGGWVDFTTSGAAKPREGDRHGDEVPAPAAIRAMRDAGLLGRVTCSSDGQGSLPVFDSSGACVGLAVGTSASLWEAIREAVLSEGVALEEAARTVTANPAEALRLGRKGRLAEGFDADILLVEPGSLAITGLVAGGRAMMAGGRLLVKGNFED
jgi:beta-aspartyl-dipeptidase (metallo-type)